jgi:hypothetical protein
VRKAVQGICLPLQVDQDGHPEENALGAAAFFCGLRTCRCGATFHLPSRRSGW